MVDAIRAETPTHVNGLDVLLSYTAGQAEAVKGDAVELLDQADTAVWALAALRSGGLWGAGFGGGHTADATDWTIVVGDLAKLAETVKILLAHAVVEHAAAGGSYAELGVAMGVPRSTAESRRSAARALIEQSGAGGWVRTIPDVW